MTLKSVTIIDPIHPGTILALEFLEPLGLSASALARHINVPPNRITSVINGQRSITGDTAIRFAAAFGTSPEFWLNLQTHYDLEVARASTDALDIAPLPAA
ncbi:MAG: HigA family addiction module antitoxin [Pseudomonadota bacterium]